MSMRKLKYSEALAEATIHAMEENPRVIVIGEGADDPKGVFGTTLEPLKKFGPDRVFDSPLSESAVTGIGVGAAIEGTPVIMVHQRNEFLLLATDQVINHAAKWRYMSGGKTSVPIVIRVLVGRGWGQAAQHSQAFHSMYAHIPGLKVILPSTPYQAKGLMLSAIKDPNPVICIEHRWLYGREEEVPEKAYEIPIGEAAVLREGKDVTCVATSYQVYEALEAQQELAKSGIEMEVIDLRSARPLDKETIIRSVRKTGRLMVTDISHKTAGITAEISAIVAEEAFDALKAPIARIASLDVPTPCSYNLEEIFYPKVKDLVQTAKELLRGKTRERGLPSGSKKPGVVPFNGPF